MSRIGRTPIALPAGVTVTVGDDNYVVVTGPKGKLEGAIRPEIKITVGQDAIEVTRPNDEPKTRSMHGLSRSLINNMVVGVTEGFKKELEINGTGYRAVKEEKAGEPGKAVLNLGFSHQVIIEEIDGITIDVPAPNRLVISGIDKQLVGQFAADVRKKRPPEPYKGKGIKYDKEVIRRKEGKTGAK